MRGAAGMAARGLERGDGVAATHAVDLTDRLDATTGHAVTRASTCKVIPDARVWSVAAWTIAAANS